jgi:hypothetical protein
MGDLRNPAVIYAKALMFLLIGLLSSVLLLAPRVTLREVLLLAAAVWGFCRAYYFAFYVIEHYVDSNYRFAGLWSFAMYMLRRKRGT